MDNKIFMPKDKFNFKKAYEELEKITEEFERGDIDLDEGLEKFKYALALASRLQECLVETENEVREIKKKFNKAIDSEIQEE